MSRSESDRNQQAPAASFPRKHLPLSASAEVDMEAKGTAAAKLATDGAFHCVGIYRALNDLGMEETLDAPTLLAEIQKLANAAASGDSSASVKLLAAQAHSLQAIYTHLTFRAMQQSKMSNLEPFMRLALKAQSQCTRTLQVMNEILNPHTVVIAKQANLASGHQQINNCASTGAREIENQQNQLLEAHHGKRLDTRTPTAAAGVDTTMETVGEIHRAQN